MTNNNAGRRGGLMGRRDAPNQPVPAPDDVIDTEGDLLPPEVPSAEPIWNTTKVDKNGYREQVENLRIPWPEVPTSEAMADLKRRLNNVGERQLFQDLQGAVVSRQPPRVTPMGQEFADKTERKAQAAERAERAKRVQKRGRMADRKFPVAAIGFGAIGLLSLGLLGYFLFPKPKPAAVAAAQTQPAVPTVPAEPEPARSSQVLGGTGDGSTQVGVKTAPPITPKPSENNVQTKTPPPVEGSGGARLPQVDAGAIRAQALREGAQAGYAAGQRDGFSRGQASVPRSAPGTAIRPPAPQVAGQPQVRLTRPEPVGTLAFVQSKVPGERAEGGATDGLKIQGAPGTEGSGGTARPGLTLLGAQGAGGAGSAGAAGAALNAPAADQKAVTGALTMITANATPGQASAADTGEAPITSAGEAPGGGTPAQPAQAAPAPGQAAPVAPVPAGTGPATGTGTGAANPATPSPYGPYRPYQTIAATLKNAMLVFDGAPPAAQLPVVAVSSDGREWVGTPSVFGPHRVNIVFETLVEGKTVTPIVASAFDSAGAPGVQATSQRYSPDLLRNLVSEAAGGLRDFSQAQLNASTTVVTTGGTTITQKAAPNLWSAVAGRALGVLALPANTQTVYQGAYLPAGSPLIIMVGAGPKQQNR